MEKDRGWVVPMAAAAFGAIFMGMIFTFLRAEDLLLTERGIALVTWLTFGVTTCALIAAFAGVIYAIQQARIAQQQALEAQRMGLKNDVGLLVDFLKSFTADFNATNSIAKMVLSGTTDIAELSYRIANTDDWTTLGKVNQLPKSISKAFTQDLLSYLEAHRIIIKNAIQFVEVGKVDLDEALDYQVVLKSKHLRIAECCVNTLTELSTKAMKLEDDAKH